jgi:uncharacterized Zn finger protein (UPF0148 family)
MAECEHCGKSIQRTYKTKWGDVLCLTCWREELRFENALSGHDEHDEEVERDRERREQWLSDTYDRFIEERNNPYPDGYDN